MSIPTKVLHQTVLNSQLANKKIRRPLGSYDHNPYQWGVVTNINIGPPPSVDLYLDGAQATGDPKAITTNVRYLDTYVPTNGDVVIVCRNTNRSSSDRWVMGKLAGSPSPSMLPLSFYDATTGQWAMSGQGLYGGPGAPNSTIGGVGDYYFNTTGAAGSRVWIHTDTGWTAIL
ncbi:MAG: hypothetical protein QXL94_00500 [Candidatus Parvarchaeum sp.]